MCRGTTEPQKLRRNLFLLILIFINYVGSAQILCVCVCVYIYKKNKQQQ